MTAGGEPETVSWLRVLLASGVVLGLLGLLSYGLKYIAAKGIMFPGRRTEGRRIEVVETLALDTRRRLVIIRRDDREHLLLLGANQDIVVEANLPSRSLAALPPSTD